MLKSMENKSKIIRWSDGTMESFHGTIREADQYARKKSEGNGLGYKII